MGTEKRQAGILMLMVLSGVCAALGMLWLTAPYGPGVSPDSVVYVDTARSLLAGKGFVADDQPLTHFPPLYPLLLAGAAVLYHGDLLLAARVLSALCYGATLLLVGLALRCCTAGSLTATGLGMLALVTSAPFLSLHIMAWSEPPFLLCLLGGFHLLALYLARPRWFVLLAASLALGSALTTRYAGVALIPPLVLALLLVGERSRREKVRAALLATTVTLLPLACWMLHNVRTAHTATNRTLTLHPIGVAHVKAFIITLYDFAFPTPLSGQIKALYLALGAALGIGALGLLHGQHYFRRHAAAVRLILPALYLMFIVAYVGLLGFSLSFVDAQIPLDSRLLLPIWLPLLVTGMTLAWALAGVLQQRVIWYGCLALLLYSSSVNGLRAIAYGMTMYQDGRDYTSRAWRDSATLAYLAAAQDTRTLYSNGPDVIQFVTQQHAVMLPRKAFPVTAQLNQTYADEFWRMVQECHAGRARVVYFHGITWRWDVPSSAELEAQAHLPVLRRFADGIVYARPHSMQP